MESPMTMPQSKGSTDTYDQSTMSESFDLRSPLPPMTQLSQTSVPQDDDNDNDDDDDHDGDQGRSPTPPVISDTDVSDRNSFLTSNRPNIDELKSYVEKLRQAEAELSERYPSWNHAEESKAAESVQRARALIMRYKAARTAFIERRTKELIAEHVTSFDGKTFRYPEGCTRDDARRIITQRLADGKENSKPKIDSKHSEMLKKLTDMAEQAQVKSTKLASSFQALRERREQVEAMVLEYEQKRMQMQQKSSTGDGNDVAQYIDVELDENSDKFITDEKLKAEKEELQVLVAKKRGLQKELADIKEKKAAEVSKVVGLKEKLLVLQTTKETQDSDEAYAEIKDLDKVALDEKIAKLSDMSDWYDSLRVIMEETSGISIVAVDSDPIKRSIMLTVCLHKEYQVQIGLEEQNKTLKVMDAKWVTRPVVSATGESGLEDSKVKVKPTPLELNIGPLDELVQVAKTMLQPPRDIRFILRETLFRIRLMQDRVAEIAALRHHVLTRVVGDKIICSLKEGVIIELYLYEKLIAVDRLVGLLGWDEKIVEEIRAGLPDYRKSRNTSVMEREEPVTITSIVQQVRDHIERLEVQGAIPQSPRYPERKSTFF